MTYGPDTQPDIQFQGDELARDLANARNSQDAAKRLIRDQIKHCRHVPQDIPRDLEWINDMHRHWQACRRQVKELEAEKSRREYERDVQRAVFAAE